MTRHPGWGVFVVGLGTLVVPFDSSVNVAFPHIIRAFDLPIPAIQWVVIAYTLAYAALTLVFGRIGDMLGYRRIFLIGSAWSTVAFLLCAAAPSYHALLAARAMQGVGAALALSCGPALATSLYPESERARVLGLYTMAFGIGGVLGTILAGQLVAWFGWSVVFWFRAPIAFAAFVFAWTLPAGTPPGGARFDGAGAAMLVVAMTGLLFALNQLGAVTSAPLGFIVATSVMIIAATGFVRRQSRVAQPIMNLRYFRDPDFALINIGQVVLNLAGFSIMLLVPFYLDRFSGLSIPAGGLALAASPLGLMLAAPIAGRLAATVPPRRLALCGAAIITVAQLVIGAVGETPVLAAFWLAMLAQGAGMGLVQVAYLDIATLTIPKHDRGVAGSLVMVTRTIGVVSAATSLMLIFQTLRASGLAHGLSEADAFLFGFETAFQVAAALSGSVVIAALLRGWHRRDVSPAPPAAPP
jgi:MFS family permease